MKRGLGIVVLLALFCELGGACKDLDPQTGDLRPACDDADSNPAVAVDFVRDIRPLIDNKVQGTKGCLFCHSPTNGSMEGFLATGLNLTQLQTLRKGGVNTGERIVVPGKPCASAIVQKLQGTFTGECMPKNGPYWDPSRIQLVRDWIAEGAQGADE